jgi:macro domain-containing protein
MRVSETTPPGGTRELASTVGERRGRPMVGVRARWHLPRPATGRRATAPADVGAPAQTICHPSWSVPAGDGRWILNFPTKRHWRQPSRLEDIADGLDDLVRLIEELGLRTIAVPPLGCGNGGLPWATVRPLIMDKLGPLTAEIRLYGPGTPRAGTPARQS